MPEVTRLCWATESDIASESPRISPIVVLIDAACWPHAAAFAENSVIWREISRVALAVCVASDFTSEATTAKPRPASPLGPPRSWR